MSHLSTHFTNKISKELYAIGRSLDIIGNPGKLSRFMTDLNQQNDEDLMEITDPTVREEFKKYSVAATEAVSESFSGVTGNMYVLSRNLSGSNKDTQHLEEPRNI
jgi:hypothetical protein